MTTTQTQLRRDTATNIAAAVPAAGEPFYDTTNKRLGVGDGSTGGGLPHASAADAQYQSFVYPSVGGTANAITLTNSPAVGSYAAPLKQVFKAAATNTTAVTVNVDGLGTKNVKKMVGGTPSALAPGDIASGGIYQITYDGTQFQVGTSSGGSGASAAVSTSTALTFSLTTSYQDVTGLTGLSITPTSSSGGVLLNGVVFAGSSANAYVRIQVLRGVTVVWQGSAYIANSAGAFPVPISFRDAPGSSSAQTYGVQIAAGSSITGYVNRDNAGTTETLTSTLTALAVN